MLHIERIMDTVIGHNAQKQALWQNDSVNTWLICGKRGIGKAKLSHAYARHITHSKHLESHPDVVIVADDSSPIGIDKVRDIKNFLHMTTICSQRKVAIIDGIDNMGEPAVNSMLKILEEPPKSSLIMLISHNHHKVPVVLRSRCMPLRCSVLSTEETKQVVSANFPNLSMADQAVALYPGTPGMITEDIEKEIAMYQGFVSLIEKKCTNSFLEYLLESDLPLMRMEYIALKALHDSIAYMLELQKSNKMLLEATFVVEMLDKYFKAQEVFATSRKLHIHRESTILRTVGIISSIFSFRK